MAAHAREELTGDWHRLDVVLAAGDLGCLETEVLHRK